MNVDEGVELFAQFLKDHIVLEDFIHKLNHHPDKAFHTSTLGIDDWVHFIDWNDKKIGWEFIAEQWQKCIRENSK